MDEGGFLRQLFADGIVYKEPLKNKTYLEGVAREGVIFSLAEKKHRSRQDPNRNLSFSETFWKHFKL